MAMSSSMLRASLNPLNMDDLQTLQNIIDKCDQLLQLITQAKAIGLPVEDIEAKVINERDIAKRIIAQLFPSYGDPSQYVVDSPEYEAAKKATIPPQNQKPIMID